MGNMHDIFPLLQWERITPAPRSYLWLQREEVRVQGLRRKGYKTMPGITGALEQHWKKESL
jgi:hypothetical protein